MVDERERDNKRKGNEGNWNEKRIGRKGRVYKGEAEERRDRRERREDEKKEAEGEEERGKELQDGEAFGVAGSSGINRSKGKLFGRGVTSRYLPRVYVRYTHICVCGFIWRYSGMLRVDLSPVVAMETSA